mmetsp:Transcript_12841/g.17216  ORF Transcript_12841/g.17216 Transcript_12841/m.17216 type:complete len:258 (-) Transcript_12841:486-1259(-)
MPPPRRGRKPAKNRTAAAAPIHPPAIDISTSSSERVCKKRSAEAISDDKGKSKNESKPSTPKGESLREMTQEELKQAKTTKICQEEFLNEAIETEIANKRWLEMQHRSAMADNVNSSNRLGQRKFRLASRRVSRRGSYVTVTFPESELMPKILRESQPLPQKSQPPVCTVTGKPARYRDPYTMLPYADAQAFKQLRRNYPPSLPTNSIPKASEQNFPTELDLPVTSVLHRRYQHGNRIFDDISIADAIPDDMITDND